MIYKADEKDIHIPFANYMGDQLGDSWPDNGSIAMALAQFGITFANVAPWGNTHPDADIIVEGAHFQLLGREQDVMALMASVVVAKDLKIDEERMSKFMNVSERVATMLGNATRGHPERMKILKLLEELYNARGDL